MVAWCFFFFYYLKNFQTSQTQQSQHCKIQLCLVEPFKCSQAFRAAQLVQWHIVSQAVTSLSKGVLHAHTSILMQTVVYEASSLSPLCQLWLIFSFCILSDWSQTQLSASHIKSHPPGVKENAATPAFFKYRDSLNILDRGSLHKKKIWPSLAKDSVCSFFFFFLFLLCQAVCCILPHEVSSCYK